MRFKTKLKKFRSSYFIIVPKKKVEDENIKVDDMLLADITSIKLNNLEVYCKKCYNIFIIDENSKPICAKCGNKSKTKFNYVIIDNNIVDEIAFKEDLEEYRCLSCHHQFMLNIDEEPYCPSCGNEGIDSIEKVNTTLVSAKEVNDTELMKGGVK